MHRTFVTGFDGSRAAEAALRHAFDRAGDEGRVVVVHARNPAGTEGSSRDDLRDALARADARAVDPATRVEVVAGDPAAALCTAARRHGADGIVIGTRGDGRANGLLGAVANSLLRRAECPVTVIPERAVVRSALRRRPS